MFSGHGVPSLIRPAASEMPAVCPAGCPLGFRSSSQPDSLRPQGLALPLGILWVSSGYTSMPLGIHAARLPGLVWVSPSSLPSPPHPDTSHTSPLPWVQPPLHCEASLGGQAPAGPHHLPPLHCSVLPRTFREPTVPRSCPRPEACLGCPSPAPPPHVLSHLHPQADLWAGPSLSLSCLQHKWEHGPGCGWS